MKRKTNKIIILTIIGLILLVSILIFVLNYSKDSSSFSLLEKKWITDNANNTIDVSIYNDVPIYGMNGSGISFEFLENFTESYNINFNKVSYLADSSTNYRDMAFKIVNSDYTLTNNDILIEEDKYVLVSKETGGIDKISDLSNQKVGILNDDITYVDYYLADAKEVAYTPYDDIDSLLESINSDTVDYIIIPKILYLDEIVSNNLNILLHINDLSKKYILTINGNETLLEIMKKYTNQFNASNKEELFDEYFVSTFFNASDITEADRMSYNSKSYTYGYVTNMPYETIAANAFAGILSNYLSGFEEMFDVDFKIVKYDDINSLRQALSSGEVDLVFANFNTNNTNIDKIFTISPFKEEYVVLAQEPFVVNTIRSLKNKEVSIVSNSYLDDYLNSNDITTKAYADTDELLRNIKNDSIIVMDKATYYYYQNRKLSNYKVLYEGVLDNNYSFVIRDVNANTTFAKLFSFYVSTVDYNTIKYEYNINEDLLSDDIVGTIIRVIVIAIILLVILFIIYKIFKKKNNKEKEISKDEKLKFIDMMTSLKNRNYLNYNIKKWEENVIYPQAIVIIDLNNIKYINDNYGHEEGDNEIKKAAAILINNQKENTDIIRTDGNEFLIYMVGYSEKDVVAYTRHIYKELKNLPHAYGAAIGYSMIEDDLKTIDDAINEATLEMRETKEKQ